MAGVESPLMVAWQACGRDEGGGRRRGQQGRGLGLLWGGAMGGRALQGEARPGCGCLVLLCCVREGCCACVREETGRGRRRREGRKREEREKEGKENKKGKNMEKISNLKISKKKIIYEVGQKLFWYKKLYV
jgi:hypothetical protein